MIIIKDSKDRNKYTEAHTYLILKVVEAIGKSIKDEQQKCVDRGRVKNNTLREVTIL